ncbi:MAG: hypothetical protein M1816_003718 [Peltula sp. TS41687]|nr:MAG: hypothetical protein M1816_003718 [Peltula sp. TS41687]
MRLLTILPIVVVWLGSALAFPVQYPSGPAHVILERRTDEPPARRKLTEEEFTVKTQEAAKGMQAAFRRVPGMRAEVLRNLGLKVSESRVLALVQKERTNEQENERAGYEGPFFPDIGEVEESSVYRAKQSREYQQQEDDAWPRILWALRDPDLLRRVRTALGLEPDGPIPDEAYTDQEWNRALIDAGHEGMLFPEANPPRPRILVPDSDREPNTESSGGSGGRAPGGKDSGGGKTSGRGFGGRQNRGGPNRFSLDDGIQPPPWSQFLSTATQSFRQKLKFFSSKFQAAGSRSQSIAPLFPTISQPIGAFGPVK